MNRSGRSAVQRSLQPIPVRAIAQSSSRGGRIAVRRNRPRAPTETYGSVEKRLFRFAGAAALASVSHMAPVAEGQHAYGQASGCPLTLSWTSRFPRVAFE